MIHCGAVTGAGLGLGAGRCGAVTRQYLGKLVKDQGCCSRFVCLGPDAQSLGMRLLFLAQGGHLLLGNFMTCCFRESFAWPWAALPCAHWSAEGGSAEPRRPGSV